MKEQYGLEVLNSLNVNNTYTLSTTKELAEQYSLKTISDLKSLPQPVTICSTLAFMNREDGLWEWRTGTASSLIRRAWTVPPATQL